MQTMYVPIIDVKGHNAAMTGGILAAVRRVIDDGQYILGTSLDRFESEVAARLGVRAAVAVNSGTDALILALKALGIGQGDEVVTTPNTFVATVAAIKHLKTSTWERERHQERAARVKAVLTSAGLPVMDSPTHIVPVMVGDPEKCKAASDLLLSAHGIYIQPINYPTVPKGTERLRIAPSPYHDDGLIDGLAEALLQVWERLGLPLRKKSLAAE